VTRRILWTARARKSLERLDAGTRARISERVEQLAASGSGDVKRLVAVEPPEYRLRVGDWRVRFEMESQPGVVVILEVLHRREAYR